MQKQSIASMSQAQYDAILDMSMNNGIKHPFETVKKQNYQLKMLKMIV